MATTHLHFPTLPFLPQIDPCRFLHCPKGDTTLPVPYDPRFLDTTHTSLQVVHNPVPAHVPVKVVNGSDGKSIPLILKTTDTIGKLKQKFLQQRPDLGGSLHLAYNGKHVVEHQVLSELGVKAGATFITFQRCTGG